MTVILVLLALVIVTSVIGELMVTHAMKVAGEIHDFRPRPFLRALGRALRTGWLPGGVGMMALSFFSFLALLSTADVSFVVPATAVTYVLNTIGAAVFLREKVSTRRWLGAILVTVGVALVSL
jgi:uncharacterized membrane protein